MKKLFASLLAAITLAAGAQTPFLSVASSPSGGNGTVTSVSVTPSNGVTGTVTTATTTPAIALTLGNITPSTVTTGTVTTTVIKGTPTIASPTLVTPTLGTATATSINKVTITAPASGSTLTISDGKTLAATASVTLAGTDGKTFTLPTQSASAVPYLGSVAYASLPACNGTNDGYKAYATDWGVNGTEVRCKSASSRWLPVNGETVLKRMGPPVSGIANVETIATQVQLPINAMQTGDAIVVRASLNKSGGTDNLQASLHVGTAGTTADTALIGLSAAAILTTTNVSGGPIWVVRVLSTTSMQRTGSGAASSSAYGVNSATAQSAATTGLADFSSNAIWLTFTVKSSSTNDTVGVQEVTIIHEAG